MLTVILSVVVFAIIFHLLQFTTTSPPEFPKEYYFTFYESFFFTIFFVGPVYLLLGLPTSIVIDLLLTKLTSNPRWLYYLYGFLSYSLAGILVGFIFLFLTSTPIRWNIDLLSFLLLCFIASTIYYHLSLIFYKLNRQKKAFHLSLRKEKTS